MFYIPGLKNCTLNTNFQAISNNLLTKKIVPSSAWTSPSFEPGWSNYGNGYNGIQYAKIGDRVEFGDGSSSDGFIFQLPDDCRPTGTVLHPVIHDFGGEAHKNIHVTASGEVKGPVGVAVTYLSLDGVSFRTK